MSQYITSWKEIIQELLGDGDIESQFAVLKDKNNIKPYIYLCLDNTTIQSIPIGPDFVPSDDKLEVYNMLPDTWKCCVKQQKNENLDYIYFKNKSELKCFIYELIDEGYVNYDGEECVNNTETIQHIKNINTILKTN